MPNLGEIESILTISNSKGKLPTINIVCNLFIFIKASFIASSLVLPKPGPLIRISVVSTPFKSAPINKLSTNSLSK